MDRKRNIFQPLAGVRILDLGQNPNGLCVILARHLGAKVVRRNAKYFTDLKNTVRIHETVRSVNVIVEDQGRELLEDYNLDYQHVKALNASVTYVSISNFGADGPRSNWKADGPILAALSGQTSFRLPCTPAPRTIFFQTVEQPVQLFALAEIMISRTASHLCAVEVYSDISRMEAASAVTEKGIVAALSGLPSPEMGDNDAEFRYFRCRDGWVLVYLGRYSERVADWIKAESSGKSKKTTEMQSSGPNSTGVTLSLLGEWLKDKKSSEVFEVAQRLRLPWAMVSSVSDLLNSPQHMARGFGEIRKVPWITIYGNKPTGLVEVERNETKSRPLNGIRIVDFSWVLAGPYASRILADAGAEIIKVQTRAVPGTLADTETPYFQTWNRNKRAVTLNLSNPEGIRLARLLISKSDAVIDSFSPRVMENMGLLPIEMCFEQPGLIWLSMSAFGATGPWRNYVAFAQTVHALTGLTSQNSDSDGTPLGLGFSFADHISGIMGSVALLGALEVRKHDGRGQWIDFSQYEALSTLFILGNKCESSDSLSDQFVFPCYGTDKWCAVRLSNDVDWDKFLSVLDIQYRTRTPQVLGPMNNAGDKKLLLNDISIVTRRFDCLHLARTLQSQGVAAGPVQKATDLISDEQMIARGYFVKSKGACFDKSLTGTWGSERLAYRQAPKLGQDNQYVFQELLGIGEEDIRDLMGSGVIW